MQCERAQLLIVDVQEKLLPAVRDSERVAASCLRLVKVAKRLGVPMTVSEQNPKGIGPTVALLINEIGNDVPVFSKLHFSCFRNEALRARIQALRTKGRNQIVLAGIEAHVCVTQTALDLSATGLQVFVVADAVSSRSKRACDLALDRLRTTGAVIVESEMVFFEWLNHAGTAEFKDLLPLINCARSQA
jgi:isochorismate hydrolase